MTKAAELKRNDVLRVNGSLYRVRQIDVQTPSARGAATLYRVRASGVDVNQKYEARFKGDDEIETVDLVRRPAQFSYVADDEVVFMDNENYSQYVLKQADVEDDMLFVDDNTNDLQVLLVEGQVVGIELPAAVTLEVVETAPAMKAASASARTKPATLNTGLVVQVPEYILQGEKIRVNTADRKFSSRA